MKNPVKGNKKYFKGSSFILQDVMYNAIVILVPVTQTVLLLNNHLNDKQMVI